jgi:hypothetical protein
MTKKVKGVLRLQSFGGHPRPWQLEKASTAHPYYQINYNAL